MFEDLAPGSHWRHRNGGIYVILMVANHASTNSDYPLMVVYRGENGNIWTRRADDWHRSMTAIPRDRVFMVGQKVIVIDSDCGPVECKVVDPTITKDRCIMVNAGGGDCLVPIESIIEEVQS